MMINKINFSYIYRYIIFVDRDIFKFIITIIIKWIYIITIIII